MRQERDARQITEELKKDTDEASLFVLHLLSSSGIFSAQDGPERVKKIIEAAESGLKRSGLSKQFGAAIYNALGNVMRDLRQYDQATNWLRQAEAIWRELDRDPKYGSIGKAPMRRELARALDSLAWAELGDKHQTNGQPERALRAAAAAWKSYEILKELDGEADDSALCAYGDWLEMNAFATGNILALVNGYIVQFATAMGVDQAELKNRMVQSLKETARLAQAKEAEKARDEVRRFLAPLVTDQRKAFRVRMAFALSQLTEKIGKPEWGLPLWILFGLSEKEIAAVRLPFAEVADEMTEWNPGNRPRVRAILEKVRESASTPATQQSTK